MKTYPISMRTIFEFIMPVNPLTTWLRYDDTPIAPTATGIACLTIVIITVGR